MDRTQSGRLLPWLTPRSRPTAHSRNTRPASRMWSCCRFMTSGRIRTSALMKVFSSDQPVEGTGAKMIQEAKPVVWLRWFRMPASPFWAATASRWRSGSLSSPATSCRVLCPCTKSVSGW